MKLIWSEESWDDYLYWQETDKRIVKKINEQKLKSDELKRLKELEDEEFDNFLE